MAVVFAKTAKGQQEMTSRSGGLTPRVRRVLILIDGSRTIDDLRTMVAADDLTHTLGVLEEEGYIEVAALRDESGDLTAPPEILPSITAFRPLPGTPATPQLDLARNFMMNTLKTFTGPYSHLTIIEKVFSAKSHAEIREQFDPWYHAIIETRDGKRRGEELREQLLKVI